MHLCTINPEPLVSVKGNGIYLVGFPPFSPKETSKFFYWPFYFVRRWFQMAFVLSKYLPYLSFFWCLKKAVRNFDTFWVSLASQTTVLHMKRLNQTESPIFVILCVLCFHFYSFIVLLLPVCFTTHHQTPSEKVSTLEGKTSAPFREYPTSEYNHVAFDNSYFTWKCLFLLITFHPCRPTQIPLQTVWIQMRRHVVLSECTLFAVLLLILD